MNDNIVALASEGLEPEASTPETEVAKADQSLENEAEQTETEQTDGSSEEVTEADKIKKLENAIGRRDKKLTKMSARYEATQSELAALREQVAKLMNGQNLPRLSGGYLNAGARVS